MGNGSRTRLQYFPLIGAIAALAVTGCGSENKSGAGTGAPTGCFPPVLQGSPAGATGSATVTGTGTLPDGIANGLEVKVTVIQDNVSHEVVADDVFSQNDRICGKTFHYSINKLAAGTYRLGFMVFVPNSDSLKPTYEGQSPDEFTIAPGATLMVDTTFRLN
jgi:hypothetical protein